MLTLVAVVLLGFVTKAVWTMEDRVARIESRLDELRYRFDPTGGWRECKESEERGKRITDLMYELSSAKESSDPRLARSHREHAAKLASEMNQLEIAQAGGEKPLNICSCGKIFADKDALAWHQARLRHPTWERDELTGIGAKPCDLPPELKSMDVRLGGPVRFEDEFYPLGNSGMLEKVVRMPNGLAVALVHNSSGKIELVEATKLSPETRSAQTEEEKSGPST